MGRPRVGAAHPGRAVGPLRLLLSAALGPARVRGVLGARQVAIFQACTHARRCRCRHRGSDGSGSSCWVENASHNSECEYAAEMMVGDSGSLTLALAAAAL